MNDRQPNHSNNHANNHADNEGNPEEEHPLGIRACLMAGFEILTRHPMLALPPLLLDLFLWLGPYISITPLLNDLGRTLEAQDPQGYQSLQPALDALIKGFKNLFILLDPAPLLGVPILLKSRFAEASPLGLRWELSIHSWTWFCFLMVLFAAAGIALNVIYLQAIGRRTIAETEAPLPGPGSPFTLWWQLIALGLLIIPLLLTTLTVIGIIYMSGLAQNRIGQMLAALPISFLFYVVFHMILAVPALVQLKRPLIKALQESAILTQLDFMRLTGIILAILLISQGFNVVWNFPETTNWLFLIGLIGHAMIVTALTAALFVFYQERLAYLRQLQHSATPRTAHLTD